MPVALNEVEETKMSQRYVSQVPTFTLESLVASGQWSAEQRRGKKKPAATGRSQKAPRLGLGELKPAKPAA
jgi:hypothetical protein